MAIKWDKLTVKSGEALQGAIRLVGENGNQERAICRYSLVITVALGSTLASIVLSKDVALTEGIVALATLILLQFLVAWSSVRSRTFGKLVKSTPSLLFSGGEYLHEAMKPA